MKDLRWPKGDKIASPFDAGSYVAIYWTLAGHHKEWDEWSLVQVKDLYESGRGFPERSHVHTATYDYVGVDYRDADGVPLTLALDHKYDAIVAVWLDGRDGRDAAATHADLSKELLPEVLQPARTWRSPPRGSPRRASAAAAGQERRWRSAPPAATTTGSASSSSSAATCAPSWTGCTATPKAVEKAGIADVLLAAPFLRTVVGTDTYVDQIW